AWQHRTFEFGTWGAEFRAEFVPAPGEIVAQEHWCSSGFANTDLDLQLKKHGIHQLIVIGLIAHTCIEATVRFAHRGQRRDGGLLRRDDARRARHQYPELRQRHCDREGSRRLYFFSLSLWRGGPRGSRVLATSRFRQGVQALRVVAKVA